jgi:hypothetical protein
MYARLSSRTRPGILLGRFCFLGTCRAMIAALTIPTEAVSAQQKAGTMGVIHPMT